MTCCGTALRRRASRHSRSGGRCLPTLRSAARLRYGGRVRRAPRWHRGGITHPRVGRDGSGESAGLGGTIGNEAIGRWRLSLGWDAGDAGDGERNLKAGALLPSSVRVGTAPRPPPRAREWSCRCPPYPPRARTAADPRTAGIPKPPQTRPDVRSPRKPSPHPRGQQTEGTSLPVGYPRSVPQLPAARHERLGREELLAALITGNV